MRSTQAVFMSGLDGSIVKADRRGLAQSFGHYAINHIKAGHARTARMHAQAAAHHALGLLGRMHARTSHDEPDMLAGYCRCQFA